MTTTKRTFAIFALLLIGFALVFSFAPVALAEEAPATSSEELAPITSGGTIPEDSPFYLENCYYSEVINVDTGEVIWDGNLPVLSVDQNLFPSSQFAFFSLDFLSDFSISCCDVEIFVYSSFNIPAVYGYVFGGFIVPSFNSFYVNFPVFDSAEFSCNTTFVSGTVHSDSFACYDNDLFSWFMKNSYNNYSSLLYDLSISFTERSGLDVSDLSSYILCFYYLPVSSYSSDLAIAFDFINYRNKVTLDTTSLSYTTGYDIGYEDGTTDGHAQGYEYGHVDGHAEGYSQGKTEGYTSGYDKGHADGLHEAFTTMSDVLLTDIETIEQITVEGYNAEGNLLNARPHFDIDYAYVRNDIKFLQLYNLSVSSGAPDYYLINLRFRNGQSFVPMSMRSVDGFLGCGNNTAPLVTTTYYGDLWGADFKDLGSSNQFTVKIPGKFTSFAFRVEGNSYGNNLQNVYDKGYKDGTAFGEKFGYQDGYNAGVVDSNEYSFFNLMSSIIDVPVNAIFSLFDLEIFGVNLAPLLTTLLSICLVLSIVHLLF